MNNLFTHSLYLVHMVHMHNNMGKRRRRDNQEQVDGFIHVSEDITLARTHAAYLHGTYLFLETQRKVYT